MVGRNPPPPSCTGALIEVKAWQVFERWHRVAFFIFSLSFSSSLHPATYVHALSFTLSLFRSPCLPRSLSLSAVTLWIAHGPRVTLHFCRACVAPYQTGRAMHMYRLMFLEWGIVYPWAKWINKCMKILEFSPAATPLLGCRVGSVDEDWLRGGELPLRKRQKSPSIMPTCHASHGRGWAASAPQSYILIITVSALPNLFAKYIIQI